MTVQDIYHTIGVVHLVDVKFWQFENKLRLMYLVWWIGQGLPKILSQYLLKNSIGDDFSLVIEKISQN